MTPTETSPIGYLLCDDLMWISRITGMANDLHLKIVPARTLSQLEKLVQQRAPVSVFLDLDTARAEEVIPRVQGLVGISTRFIAFGSHVAVDVLQAARNAGCELVLPRSKMAELLPLQLSAWMEAQS